MLKRYKARWSCSNPVKSSLLSAPSRKGIFTKDWCPLDFSGVERLNDPWEASKLAQTQGRTNLKYVKTILKVRGSTGKVRVQCGSNTGSRTQTLGFPKKSEVFLDMWKCPRFFLARVEFYRFWCYSGHGVGPGVWSNFDTCPNETMWFSWGPSCYGIVGAAFSKLIMYIYI